MRTLLTVGAMVWALDVSFVLSPQAQGCCEAAAEPCAAYWNAAAVFVGRVEAVTRVGTMRTVSFSVREGFHGVTASTIDVSTGPAGQRCSLAFTIGRDYIVFADRAAGANGGAPGGLITSRCSGTRDVGDAGAELAYGRDVKQGTAPSGHISGRVLLEPRDLAGQPAGPSRPVPDMTVIIARDGGSDTTTTDAAGDFRVESRGPGTYRVTVNVPERFYSDDPAAIVALRDPRSCAAVTATLHDNGQVAGRVVDAAGRPVAGLTMEFGPSGKGPGARIVTGRDGRYVLSRLPPGRFVLSVPGGPSPAIGGRTARVFYPGVETLTASSRVAVASGARTMLADFRIPAHYKYVAVSGVVFDADGTPAEGARVFLKGVGDDDRIVSEPVAADFMGGFVIAARAGTEYRLFAERPRPGGRSSRVDSTDPMPLTAAEGLAPVRLKLERRY
jgi:Carboxypeptidase regulatory-like domain